MIIFILFSCNEVKGFADDKKIKVNVVDLGADGSDLIDDTHSIQRALDTEHQAQRLEVRIPDGVYLLSKSLKISSNTKLILSKGTILKRNASYSPMIINKTKGAAGYSGNRNISIEGGTWEGNYDQFPTTFCIMLFGHMENLTIKNTKLLHDFNSHLLELNAVKNANIVDNYFDGYKGKEKKEALQLDLAKNKGVFPPFGQYDNTPCEDILITHNTFINQSRGIGSHSYSDGVFHKKIKIENNKFINIKDEGIKLLNYNDVIIRNNLFDHVHTGIEFRSEQIKGDFNIVIYDNQFVHTENDVILEENTFNLLYN